KYPMRFWIERHRSRTALGCQTLDHRQFVRRFFFSNCCCAVAARCERELQRIIKRAAVNPRANGNSVDKLSSFRIEHRHHFVVTPRKQSMMVRVEGDAARTFSWS